MKLINNKRGFTLVELLLVMAIIGILAGVIFMAISPARQRARMTNFKEQVNSINTAATLCVDGGGTIQSAAPGGDMCSTAGTQVVPAMKFCDNGAPLTNSITGLSNPSNEGYSFSMSCNSSGSGGCTGTCTVDGCTFTGCN